MRCRYYVGEDVDEDDHRAHADAVASVVYNTVAGMGLGWPTISTGKSIFLNSLTANPNLGPSWTRSGAAADSLGSFNAMPLEQELIDHPGGDIGSPGTVGVASATELYGDYNNDGHVNALDYTKWRNSLGAAGSTLSHRDPLNSGNVSAADFTSWKMHYGDIPLGSGGLADGDRVPEPAGATMLLAGIGLLLRARQHD